MKILLFLTIALTYRQPNTDACPTDDYPRQYIAYRIGQDEHAIDIDGRIDDDPAWRAVAWSQPFVDIAQANAKPPRFETRFKARYDARFLYIGAHLEERQVWANQTRTNSVIFHDNDFEVFVDAAATTHHYREIELNALNVNWTLTLPKPYLNGGRARCDNLKICQCCFRIDAPARSSVYVEPGPVNDASVQSRFWSLEMALPLEQLSNGVTTRGLWRVNFSRVQWRVDVVGDRFVKRVGVPEDNWVWQRQGVVNMHLPERWGYLQFEEGPVNSSALRRDVTFELRRALVAVYEAEVAYRALFGRFIDQMGALVREVRLDEEVAAGACGNGVPHVTLDEEFGFFVDIRRGSTVRGRIRGDRYISCIEE